MAAAFFDEKILNTLQDRTDKNLNRLRLQPAEIVVPAGSLPPEPAPSVPTQSAPAAALKTGPTTLPTPPSTARALIAVAARPVLVPCLLGQAVGEFPRGHRKREL